MLENQSHGGMVTPEQGEQLISHAPWLGGIFETAGTITITGGRSTDPNPRVTPDLSLIDNSRDRLLAFHTITGFPLTQATPHSWVAQTQGGRVVSFAETIEPFAPSRQQIIAAIKALPYQSPEQQLQVARTVPYLDRFQDLTPDHYSDFVKNPAQVAGAIDVRGIFAHTLPDISLVSRNIPLLKALQETFRGSLEYTEEGEVKMAHGQQYIVRHSTAEWRVKYSHAKNLVTYVLPFLEMRKNEAQELLNRGRS